MEYEIISGQVIEKRRSYMTVRSAGESAGRRAPRQAGTSSEKKIKANEREQVRRAARTVNCNFSAGDVHTVLKYEDAFLPESFAQAEGFIKAVLDKARRKYIYGRGKAVQRPDRKRRFCAGDAHAKNREHIGRAPHDR